MSMRLCATCSAADADELAALEAFALSGADDVGEVDAVTAGLEFDAAVGAGLTAVLLWETDRFDWCFTT